MSVTICEVGPRDGLQNLPRLFSVQERAHLIAELAAAGLRQIEAVSMVNPARVPQMADAEAVLDALPPLPAVQLSALVLNRRGAERALATGKSLLPAGVKRVEGAFARGDAVSILSESGVEIGRGLVAYDRADAERIMRQDALGGA